MVKYVSENGLKLNKNKTKLIIFKTKNKRFHTDGNFELDGVKLVESKNVRFLGLVIDSKLTYDDHINYISNKIAPVVGMLYKLNKNLPIKSLKLIYNVLVGSHLQYLNEIWGLTTKTNLKQLQNHSK